MYAMKPIDASQTQTSQTSWFPFGLGVCLVVSGSIAIYMNHHTTTGFVLLGLAFVVMSIDKLKTCIDCSHLCNTVRTCFGYPLNP